MKNKNTPWFCLKLCGLRVLCEIRFGSWFWFRPVPTSWLQSGLVRVRCVTMAVLIFLAACGGMKDDLFPSNSDKRSAAPAGTTGPAVGQSATDFTLPDTLGSSFTLSSAIPAHRAVVLYFTMWCPTCDAHMTILRDEIMPRNPDAAVVVIDYVSGTAADARNAQVANGYANAGFTVLADTAQSVLSHYRATMGSTVVIDRSGIVRMNEDMKNGAKLQSVLGELQ